MINQSFYDSKKEWKFFICPMNRNTPTSTFHATWISFFLCFFGWFGISALYPWISLHLNISSTESSKIFALGNTISAVSTVTTRIIIGFLCDFIHPRYSYLIVIIGSILTQIAFIFVNTSTQYLYIQILTGIIGASFVITEYHMTTMYHVNCIGLVMATAAGWGNLGGGVSTFLMPVLCKNVFNNNWQLTMLVSILMLLLIALPLYLFIAKDTPMGNTDRNDINKVQFKKLTKIFFTKICCDLRVWILFLAYAACFGIEVLTLRYASRYFQSQFNVSVDVAGGIVLGFSSLNLFARSFGGYTSDIINTTFSVIGRVYTLFICMLISSIFMLLFALMEFNLYFSILVLLALSLYIQANEGIVFALSAFIHPEYNGMVFGIVGAGGNFGVLFFSLIVYRHVPEIISYSTSFMLLSLFMFIVSFLTLFVRFTDKQKIDVEKELELVKLDNIPSVIGLNKSISTISSKETFQNHITKRPD